MKKPKVVTERTMQIIDREIKRRGSDAMTAHFRLIIDNDLYCKVNTRRGTKFLLNYTENQ